MRPLRGRDFSWLILFYKHLTPPESLFWYIIMRLTFGVGSEAK
ncbi:hypothetical protein TBC1_11295 [Lentimicrobium saccharophilum]|uniref:Uncharacterized protein n=1 Tax=Lentimicrobium saccharophilum TaxID=1678841 RepID=A0A0S7BYW8_9BACT|nr:hypothetical protein TBC1_11295 [Lentimicrobium saccharophilum]